ncbi:hypothetical protein EVAR_22689_1 [Eumeta japonica]|uniref:Uncharacterized protein n=1 Tax=Eumeta variegata TaxID=151549 RepID=A0A4C1US90_EUMVA|nr:hypothetical protein EVAR_22689_1 [Eumeta japonica]
MYPWSLSFAAIAFDIPVEELGGRRAVQTWQLQPPQADITLPDIQEKLAEAEIRRQMILQQRAASAQKRTQKMMKSLHEMDRLDSEHELMEPENKHGSSNTLKIPADPVAWVGFVDRGGETNRALARVHCWEVRYKLRFAPSKTNSIVLTKKLKYDDPVLHMNSE